MRICAYSLFWLQRSPNFSGINIDSGTICCHCCEGRHFAEFSVFLSDTAQMSLKFIIVYLGGLPVLTGFMATVQLGFKEECWWSFSSTSSKLMKCASCVACAENRNDLPP